MNQTIDLILSHRSIRQFTAEPIAPQQLDAILAAAQSASTSSFLQVTSIVRVCEPEARQQLLIGAIDGALMAQNALLAAQSLGLGGVYIGGIRNHPAEVSELLGLPHQVIPLFGLCLGHPAQQPEQKPRLPRGLVVHQERYLHELDRDLLAQYDQQIADYYQARSSNNKQQTWSGQIRAILGKESRPFMLGFLQSRGFNLK
ncbi:oxygen-insensitive NADPH nitroreductase [Aeromonas veronii]|uniref:oxygen-insensitive NADPH nitroreductase n=1 Tax=Aeromonas TaxID=642 RepID=UPI00214D5B6A|nr:oxygen-insensitive NADPH nitroreductase [Aeromonas veronii]MCR3963797.1 oxygen-insensitive NADPH nitroreductase [Aeromonas veronii]